MGLKEAKKAAAAPCGCVLRAVFRACYKRFVECAYKDIDLSRVSLELGSAREHGVTWGRKNEEYVADFLRVTKRSLTDDEHRLFRYHYLLGADWRLCCRKLDMDKGVFFHAVYRIQQKLGRVFRELKPYPLYPLSDYFSPGDYRGGSAKVVSMSSRTKRPRTVVPLNRSAA
jgi:hypothetical protein